MKPKDIILFNISDQKVWVSVYFQKGTFWLTQKPMAELFDVNVPAIIKHLKNIFETKELAEDSVISVLETTASDGKNNSTKFNKFRMSQDKTYESDFDRIVKELENKENVD